MFLQYFGLLLARQKIVGKSLGPSCTERATMNASSTVLGHKEVKSKNGYTAIQSGTICMCAQTNLTNVHSFIIKTL